MDARVADVVETTVTNGEVRVKLGNATDGFGYMADAPVYGPANFYSRPAEPDGNGDTAQAYYVKDGDQGLVLDFRDNRYSSKVGELEHGDSAIVTKGEARILVKSASDSVFLMSKNQVTGKTMIQAINGEDGVISIFNGNCWISMTGDSIQLSAGNGSQSSMITINAQGIHFLGNSFNCGTMGGHFGYMVPPAPPVPGVAPVSPINSVVVGPDGNTGVGSAKWTMTM